MNIYKKRTHSQIYRKIYEQHHGPIPKDENGRTYEVHHIDGNHTNNHPSNLMAVTIQEHYDIHYSQGDWFACLIMSDRMKMSPEEISELARLGQLKRVAEGTHHLLSGDIQRITNSKRVADGSHNFLDGKAATERNLKRVVDGTHPFLGGEIQRESNKQRVKNGSHHLLGGDIQKAANEKRMTDGSHNFCQTWTCPHCGKKGKNLATYARWHGDNCKVINS